jgi:hypothetical protein
VNVKKNINASFILFLFKFIQTYGKFFIDCQLVILFVLV